MLDAVLMKEMINVVVSVLSFGIATAASMGFMAATAGPLSALIGGGRYYCVFLDSRPVSTYI